MATIPSGQKQKTQTNIDDHSICLAWCCLVLASMSTTCCDWTVDQILPELRWLLTGELSPQAVHSRLERQDSREVVAAVGRGRKSPAAFPCSRLNLLSSSVFKENLE